MLPKLVHLPLTISAYASGVVTLSLTPPANARLAVIGVKVDQLAALYDHEVTSIQHGTYEGVSTHAVNSTVYGAPLGTVANYFGPLQADGDVQAAVRPFRPWPGRMNSLFDLTRLLAKQWRGEQLSKRELQRALIGGAYPARDFAAWKLDPNVTFTLTAKRIYGATAITYASLVCIELDEVQEELLCDGRADLTDRPHWLVQAAELVAASGSVIQNERKWAGASLPGYGLKVLQSFAQICSNNSGTKLYDDTYLSKVLVRFLGKDQEALVKSYADKRQLITAFTTQLLQEYDQSKEFGLELPWQTRLHVETETLTSTYQKDLRLVHYGLLRQSDALGNMND